MSAVVCQFPDSIGVCYGRLANNLPKVKDVVELYKEKGIKLMRIYDRNQETLKALEGSDIQLILDVPNDDLESLQSESDATHWVKTNVGSHFPATKIRYIAVGNEVDPNNPETSSLASLVLPAMKNIYKALCDLGVQHEIKVSTATYSALLDDTTPPSSAWFNDNSFMEDIIPFLAQTGAPLLANIHPYFAYIRDMQNIQLEYALFTSPGVVVQDGDLGYQNLFDAMVDGVYSALEKAGGKIVDVVVSASGWPSEGGVTATKENAEAYYRNLIKHVEKGTPKRPGKATETYLFAMFDENLNPGPLIQQHFGLFYHDKTPKYDLP